MKPTTSFSKTRRLIALCLIALFARPLSASTTRQTKPNVVIILADDLGYADIGVQAVEKDVVTPNIDSIAKDGVRFTQGYVSCPVCSPSRAGILTGKYHERFGYEGNPVKGYDSKFGLPLDQVTLGNEMKRVGYVTGAFGKWHLGNEPPYYPLRRGFDEFFGFLGGMHFYLGNRTPQQQGFNAIRRGNDPVDEKEYLTDAITREAVEFIDHHQHEPFFAYVAYNAVHVPQQAPAKYLDRFSDSIPKKRRFLLAMLAAEDDGVGKILAKLHEARLDDNTLVIFLSDNGGPTAGNGSRNAPLRGFKGQVWEGGIRIPFMARWPGHIPSGQVLDTPVISLDLFPTALAAAGAEPQANLNLDGANLLPLITGTKKFEPHHVLYWRFTPQWAIRDGNSKLEKARDGIVRLYDLKKDPGEKEDLASAQPELVKKLQAEFDAWNKTLHAPLWPSRQEGARDAAMIDMQEAAPDAD